jgi:hypothetical protein
MVFSLFLFYFTGFPFRYVNANGINILFDIFQFPTYFSFCRTPSLPPTEHSILARELPSPIQSSIPPQNSLFPRPTQLPSSLSSPTTPDTGAEE